MRKASFEFAMKHSLILRTRTHLALEAPGGAQLQSFDCVDPTMLGWPLQPFEKYEYIRSPIKAIRENIKYPRGLPRMLKVERRSRPKGF